MKKRVPAENLTRELLMVKSGRLRNGEHGFGAFAPNFLSADGRIRYHA